MNVQTLAFFPQDMGKIVLLFLLNLFTQTENFVASVILTS